jgi:hypothetical protein
MGFVIVLTINFSPHFIKIRMTLAYSSCFCFKDIGITGKARVTFFLNTSITSSPLSPYKPSMQLRFWAAKTDKKENFHQKWKASKKLKVYVCPVLSFAINQAITCKVVQNTDWNICFDFIINDLFQ